MDARTLHDIAAVEEPLERARAASDAMATLQGQSVEVLRRWNDPGGDHPFVLGRRGTDRFMAVMDLMLRGRTADAEHHHSR